MDRAAKQAIESTVWDRTTGAGIDPEVAPARPDRATMDALARALGRPLAPEEAELAAQAWRRCVQAMAQP